MVRVASAVRSREQPAGDVTPHHPHHRACIETSKRSSEDALASRVSALGKTPEPNADCSHHGHERQEREEPFPTLRSLITNRTVVQEQRNLDRLHHNRYRKDANPQRSISHDTHSA